MQTVVGLYRTVDEANKVKQALLSEGYSGGDVTVIDQSESASGTSAGAYATTAASGSSTGSYGLGTDREAGSYGTGLTGTGTGIGSGVTGLSGSGTSVTDQGYDRGTNDVDNGEGVGSKIKHFFQGLTGHDEHTHSAYTEGVSRGGALVAVNVSEGEADRAAAILQSYGASDIEGGNATGGSYAGTDRDFEAVGTNRGNVTGEQVIPVVQEDLVVGKRQVERGGVRVYSRVVSEPVSESVSLHDERVLVDRHAVNRPATEADFTNAGPIEVRAMGEEAVVGKTGRVVEEVVVGKTANDRTETIQDSVRRTEVEVEQVNTGSKNTTTDSSKY